MPGQFWWLRESFNLHGSFILLGLIMCSSLETVRLLLRFLFLFFFSSPLIACSFGVVFEIHDKSILLRFIIWFMFICARKNCWLNLLVGVKHDQTRLNSRRLYLTLICQCLRAFLMICLSRYCLFDPDIYRDILKFSATSLLSQCFLELNSILR